MTGLIIYCVIQVALWVLVFYLARQVKENEIVKCILINLIPIFGALYTVWVYIMNILISVGETSDDRIEKKNE